MFFPLLDGKVKNSLLLYFSVFLVYVPECRVFDHIFHFVFHRFCQGIVNSFLLFYLGFFRPLLK